MLRRDTAPRASVQIEGLEFRRLLDAGPTFHIDRVIADNRGEIFVTLSEAADPTTIAPRTIQMYTAGADRLVGTADDVRQPVSIRYTAGSRRILLRAQVPADEGYRIKMNGRLSDADRQIRSANGGVLDGEFVGTFPTGDGAAGGNFEFQSKNDRSGRPQIRMYTSLGVLNFNIFRDTATQTFSNFRSYADSGRYDSVFFTRSVSNFIIQGGSLQDQNGTVVPTTLDDPVVNEFGASNTRGTISMAKRGGDPNSATNQFFFNLGDNGGNLDNQNGGFTVFGELRGAEDLAVMDAIAGLDQVALNNGFSGGQAQGVLTGSQFAATGLVNVPVVTTDGMQGSIQQVTDGAQFFNQFLVTGGLNPSAQLVFIRRVAQRVRVVAL